MNELPGVVSTFLAQDTGQPKMIEILQKYCNAPTSLELKIDCQVILLKNISVGKELVNGAR